MKPDSMLVEAEYLVDARQQVARTGAGGALKAFDQSEPAMAGFIHESLAAIVGKLVLTGASGPVVQGAHEDMLAVVLTCVQALRRGHYELWKDSMDGTRQVPTAPPFKPKAGRKRKKSDEQTKRDEGNAEQESV